MSEQRVSENVWTMWRWRDEDGPIEDWQLGEPPIQRFPYEVETVQVSPHHLLVEACDHIADLLAWTPSYTKGVAEQAEEFMSHIRKQIGEEEAE